MQDAKCRMRSTPSCVILSGGISTQSVEMTESNPKGAELHVLCHPERRNFNAER